MEAIATDHEATVRPASPLAYLPDTEALSKSTGAKEVIERESELNFKFLAPEDIRSNKESAYSMYCAFVFVKNLLVGSHI